MKSIKILSVFVITTLFMSNLVLAEEQPLREKLSKGQLTLSADVKGCDKDAEKFCKGLELGSEKGFMCMMAYEDMLSKQCKRGIAEAALAVRQGIEAINYSIKACEDDADKFCLKVQPGEGRLVGCLKKNKSKVSKACVSALQETGLWDMGAK